MKSRDRAEHVGSLLRPPELLKARDDFAEKRLHPEQLREIEDRAILGALERQSAAGLDRITDGEFRRGSWLTDMADAVEGFVRDRVVLDWKGPGGGPEVSSANAVGAKLRKTRHLTAHEVPFLVASSKRPFKVTLPAPSNFVVCSYRPGITEKFYPKRADLLQDLIAIIREEVNWLVSQGVTYIQFDAPYYTHYLDPRHRAQMQAEGRDPDQELAEGIAGDNAALADLPRDRVTVATHVCRGNSRSRWFTEGGYDGSPNGCSAHWMSTGYCSSSMTTVPAVSSRCDGCRPARRWCWGWSRPRTRSSNRRMLCGAASTKRLAMCL